MIKYVIIFLFPCSLLYAQQKPKPFVRSETMNYVEFYDPVDIIRKGYMVDGFIEGECRGYLKNNQSILVLVEHYKKGKKCGQSIQYYPNGMVCVVGMFDNDKLTNIVMYDTSGTYGYFQIPDNTKEVGFGWAKVLSITWGIPNYGGMRLDINDSISYAFDTIGNKFIRIEP